MREFLNHYEIETQRIVDHNTFVAHVHLGNGLWQHDVHIQILPDETGQEKVAAENEALEDVLFAENLIIQNTNIDGFGRWEAKVFTPAGRILPR